jgi:hypothetical protein
MESCKRCTLHRPYSLKTFSVLIKTQEADCSLQTNFIRWTPSWIPLGSRANLSIFVDPRPGLPGIVRICPTTLRTEEEFSVSAPYAVARRQVQHRRPAVRDFFIRISSSATSSPIRSACLPAHQPTQSHRPPDSPSSPPRPTAPAMSKNLFICTI